LRVPVPLVEGTRNELKPRVLRLSDAACALLIRFSDAIEVQLGPSGPLEPIRGFANKAAEHAARLAAVRELFEDLGCEEVTVASMADAIFLVQYYLSEADRIRANGRINPDIALAEKLLDWLQTEYTEPNDLVSLPEVYQFGPYAIRDKDTAERIMLKLQNHGFIEPAPTSTKTILVKGKPRRQAWKIVREQ
jgi:hypothetical protein